MQERLSGAIFDFFSYLKKGVSFPRNKYSAYTLEVGTSTPVLIRIVTQARVRARSSAQDAQDAQDARRHEQHEETR